MSALAAHIFMANAGVAASPVQGPPVRLYENNFVNLTGGYKGFSTAFVEGFYGANCAPYSDTPSTSLGVRAEPGKGGDANEGGHLNYAAAGRSRDAFRFLNLPAFNLADHKDLEIKMYVGGKEAGAFFLPIIEIDGQSYRMPAAEGYRVTTAMPGVYDFQQNGELATFRINASNRAGWQLLDMVSGTSLTPGATVTLPSTGMVTNMGWYDYFKNMDGTTFSTSAVVRVDTYTVDSYPTAAPVLQPNTTPVLNMDSAATTSTADKVTVVWKAKVLQATAAPTVRFLVTDTVATTTNIPIQVGQQEITFQTQHNREVQDRGVTCVLASYPDCGYLIGGTQGQAVTIPALESASGALGYLTYDTILTYDTLLIGL